MLEFQSPYEADLVFSGSQLGDLINDTDNPWLTLGIMDSIDDPDLLREWGVLLGMQTRLLGPREVEWLRSNGFGVDGAGILEPGSGDGTYGSFLARNFPEARIYGLEANSSLAGRFRPKEEVPNYSIDICKVGDDPLPQNLSGKFNQCFLRFVLQHTSDPRPLLLAAYNALPSGGKLYVIEEDHGFLTAEPAWPPYALAKEMWARTYAHGGSDGGMGRKLPKLATAAGFTVNEYDVVLRNNVEMGEDFLDLFTQFSRVLHYTDSNIVTPGYLQDITDGFNGDRVKHDESFVATYPQIMLVATKP